MPATPFTRAERMAPSDALPYQVDLPVTSLYPDPS